MAEPRSPRIPAASRDDGRTPLGRFIESRGFKPYAHPGDAEPPEVTAARQRHRAVSERIQAARDALEAGQAGQEPC